MNFQQKLHHLLELEVKRHAAIKDRNEVISSPPYHIYVEPTNACFLKCVFCVEKERKGGKIGFLTMEMWKRIVDSLAKYDILAPINIIGRGEPLMNKKMVEFIEYGSENGLNCSIITNGVLLKKEMGERLIKAGIRKIQFSYHAHSPETYRQLTGFDYFDRVKQNILDLVETNEKHGKPCFINVMAVENSINRHETEAFLKYWQNIVDNCFITPIYSVQGESLMADEAIETTFSDHPKTKHPGCVNPFIFIGIRYDGSIVPCPYDFPGKFIVGNVMDDGFDLMRLWNCDKIRNLRRCQTTLDFSYCKEIDYPCETCDVPFAPDSYKGLTEYTDHFPIVFSRMFGPILRNA